MLLAIHPKLPMRDKTATRDFYVNKLNFQEIADYPDYLMVKKDHIELHFFAFPGLNPLENDGQVYIRTDDIEAWYQKALDRQLPMPQAGHLAVKPWQQKEFSLLDPDHNLLTFGQSV
jgi:catechol 2,3-dioxygenase-like lactoylglutathione lyase family enzyme